MDTDILMRIKREGNYLGVPGETQTVIDKDDELSSDFTQGKFLQIKDFTFGISLVDKGAPMPSQQDLQKLMQAASRNAGGGGEEDGDNKDGGMSITIDGRFKKFMEDGVTTTGQGRAYPVTFDEVVIRRLIDSSLTGLLQNCFKRKTVEEISIVMRKPKGNASDSARAGGNAVSYVGYLRVDFKQILITDMSLSLDDDAVLETTKFVYREVGMRYRPQKNDGSLDSTVAVDPPLKFETVKK